MGLTGSNNTNPGQGTNTDSSPVVISSDQSAIPISGTVTPAGPAIIDTLTGAATLTIDTTGMGSVTVNILGSWTGQIEFEAQISGGTFEPVSLQDMFIGDGNLYSSATANSLFTGNIAGFAVFRVRGNTVTGTANIEIGAAASISVLQGIKSDVFTQSSTRDGSGNPLDSSTSAPAGTEQALIVRNIPSGTQTISGAITGTGNFTVTQATGSNLHTVIDSGTTTVTQATGTNLHTVIDSGTTTVTQATGTNLHTVVDSGTVTTVSTVTNLSQMSGAAIAMGTGVRTAGTQRVTIATDDSVPVTLAANQSVNVAQMNGVTVTMGNGASGTGVQRVTLANDSTGVVSLATGANTIGALTANQSVNVAQMNGTTVTMGNGASGTGVQRVTLANDSTGVVSLATGANTIGALTANQSVNIAQMNGVTVTMGNGASGTGVQRVTLANDSTGTIVATGPTLTKGTQGSTGFSVQNLRDAGRTSIRFYAIAAAAGTTTTETAITLTKSSETAATSTGTSFVVTNGKRFRITNMSFATRGHSTATIQTTTFNFRVNTGGAVTTGSTPIVLAVRSATPATASAWDRVYVDAAEGWEIVGDGTLQIGITAAATYTTNAPTWDVTIMGYEY